MKIERLTNGYAKRPIIKQSTASAFSDGTGSNDEKVKTEVPISYENAKREYVIQESRPKSANSNNSNSSNNDQIGYVDPNERALHKIVSNTLKYYQFNENYNTDIIMKLYSEHDLIRYAGVATNDANPRDLNSIIDMGEYPIVKVFNKKPLAESSDIENNNVQPQPDLSKKNKKERDVTFLPPRPNKYLDVITYSECSPNFEIRDEQIPEDTLAMSNTDRQEFIMTITQINKLLKPLRGKVALYDRFILLYLIFGIIIAGSLGVLLWIFLHYAISILIGVVYFSILGGFVYVTKRKTSILIK
mmetsp:Transcript_4942/g.5624  ORF Transcript_4942/g.5624 Transcript_4942/m.5624 type:complete len:302 (+) Transcript_4942:245-1150(+)